MENEGYTTYHNHRDEPYFTFLKNGQKTVEGRIKKEWYRSLRPGDHIVVHNKSETDQVETRVKEVRTYASIREMLERESIQNLLPDVTSIDRGVEVYRRFYTPEQEREFGVVAIEVERVSVDH